MYGTQTTRDNHANDEAFFIISIMNFISFFSLNWKNKMHQKNYSIIIKDMSSVFFPRVPHLLSIQWTISNLIVFRSRLFVSVHLLYNVAIVLQRKRNHESENNEQIESNVPMECGAMSIIDSVFEVGNCFFDWHEHWTSICFVIRFTNYNAWLNFAIWNIWDKQFVCNIQALTTSNT